MSEDIPEHDQIPPNAPVPPDAQGRQVFDNPPEPLGLDINPPEPDDAASVRAERGSPTPSCVTVNQHPSLPDPPIGVNLVDPQAADNFVPDVPAPPGPSSSSADIPADPEAQNAISSELFALLLNNGFDEQAASIALQRTGNAGLDQAVAWIIEHSNPSEFDSDSGESDSEEDNEPIDVDMGASSSAPTDGMAAAPGGSAGPSSTGENPLVKAMMAAAKRSRTHKMVLVANMGLKMTSGKLAAQVGHATLAVYRQAMASEAGQSAVDSWMRHGQVKIVVKGNSTEELMDLFKVARDEGCFAYLVQDAGYTQIPPGSRTVLGVFGEKERVDAVTGKLRLL